MTRNKLRNMQGYSSVVHCGGWQHAVLSELPARRWKRTLRVLQLGPQREKGTITALPSAESAEAVARSHRGRSQAGRQHSCRPPVHTVPRALTLSSLPSATGACEHCYPGTVKVIFTCRTPSETCSRILAVSVAGGVQCGTCCDALLANRRSMLTAQMVYL